MIKIIISVPNRYLQDTRDLGTALSGLFSGGDCLLWSFDLRTNAFSLKERKVTSSSALEANKLQSNHPPSLQESIEAAHPITK